MREWLAELHCTWPKDERGRPLEWEEFHPGFAAADAVERAHENPNALGIYLEDWLDIRPTPEREQALWEVVTKRLNALPDEHSEKFFDPERCIPFLRGAVYGRASRIKTSRDIADKPWGLRGWRAERRSKVTLPEMAPLDPVAHGGEEASPETEYVRVETNRDLMQILEDLSKEEKHKTRALIALESVGEGRSPKDVAELLGGWDKWQGLQDAARRRLKNSRKNIEDVS